MLRGIVLWLLIMAAETAHGVLRGILLVPTYGESVSSRIGWPVGMVIVLGLTMSLIRWTGLVSVASLFRLGTVWAVLTFLFETGIGLLRGLDGARIWTEFNPMTGGLMLYSLAVMLIAPLLSAWLRGRLKST